METMQMLIDADKIEPYSRQLLWVFLQAAQRSPDLTVSQKTKIESLCQEIVNEWTKKDESK